MEKIQFKNYKQSEDYKKGLQEFKEGKIKNQGVCFKWWKTKVPVKEWNNYYSKIKGSYTYLGNEGKEIWIGFLSVEEPLNAIEITDVGELTKIQMHREAIKQYPQPMEKLCQQKQKNARNVNI